MRRSRGGTVDKPLVILAALLIVAGCMIFASAAFGLLARGQQGIPGIVLNHIVLGLGLGLVLMAIAANVDYRLWRRWAPHLFGVSLFATALVFIPHIGATHLGGRRWIDIARFSFQPSEILKLTSVLVAATYLATIRSKIRTLKWGLGGFFAVCAVPALLLVLQPDLGTLGVVVAGIAAVFFAGGMRMRDIALTVLLALSTLALLAAGRPYVRDRVMTFIHPSQNRLIEGYQIRQSLIAIGSGGLLGRGFGQGVQKFTYLPEPMGDSIFAVAGEELGFFGAIALVALYLALALRAFFVAVRAPDLFGSLVSVGIGATLVSEAFINMAAMLGILPLTGIPLTFVSQGGSAILVSLAMIGILFNISRYRLRGGKM